MVLSQWLLVVLLLGSSLGADLPSPRIKYKQPGHVEISIEDVPGVKYLNIQYGTDSKHQHYGPFHKAVDGQWYHHNAKGGLGLDSRRPVKYKLTAEISGKVVSLDGTFSQGDAGLAVMPPQRMRRAGYVVFRDDFNLADGSGPNTADWVYELSMYGGYNWEIQVYTNSRQNAFIRGGKLYLKPTPTVNDPRFDENFLNHGVMDVAQLWGKCTNDDRYGCHREGQYGTLPPIMSAKLKTRGKHTIRYGKVTVRAKIPKGDWIWPAIWMLPESSHYGTWPRSGEIDIMESRGNMVASDGRNHGVNQVSSTLHWGPDASHNGFMKTHGDRDSNSWSSSFHDYVLDWTADHIIVTVDGQQVMSVYPPGGGFYQWGGFGGANPWSGGSKMAPFDQAFYLILNVAVGGTSGFFPDSWHYNSPKPWKNGSTKELQEFWDRRNDWLPSWHGDDVALCIDSVEMLQY